MEIKNMFLFLIIGIMLIGIMQITNATKTTDKVDAKYTGKEVIKYDGIYKDGVKIKDKKDSQVYIDKITYDKSNNKVYHVDSLIKENINVTLQFYYEKQPDTITHIQHSGKTERTYYANEWTWTADCNGEECYGGWVTINVDDIDYGVGSNTFPIGTIGPTWARDGKFAGSFNGLNSKILTNNITTCSNNSATISLWINPSSIQSSPFGEIGGLRREGGSGKIYLYFNNNTYYVALGVRNETKTQGVIYSATNSIKPNNWYSVIATYSPTNVELYINGVATGGGLYSGEANYSFGCQYTFGTSSLNSNYFLGYEDNIQIWNTTLDATQITTIYSNGRINSPCSLVTENQTFCVDFDDYSTADMSGNNNNGLNTNVSFEEIQGNYNSLSSGVDYSINTATGLFTLFNVNYLYEYVLTIYQYDITNKSVCNSLSTTIINSVSYIGLFVLAVIFGIILVIVVGSITGYLNIEDMTSKINYQTALIGIFIALLVISILVVFTVIFNLNLCGS